MKPQDQRLLVCAGFALLTVLFAGAAQAAPLVTIAEERLEPFLLVLEPRLEFEQATLTVEGPAGFTLERVFAPGDAVGAALIDDEGRALPDGRYKYSLRLSPQPEGSSGVHEACVLPPLNSRALGEKRLQQ